MNLFLLLFFNPIIYLYLLLGRFCLFTFKVIIDRYILVVIVLIVSRFGEGNGTPLLYSCLENPMVRGAWWAAVHGVAKSRTRLRSFTSTFHFHALEKEMATHSNTLAWKIPWSEEPGGLQSTGSRRVGHD